jgi:hypothetical protein
MESAVEYSCAHICHEFFTVFLSWVKYVRDLLTFYKDARMVDHPELGQKLPMEFSTIVVIHLLNVTSPSVCTSSVHFYVEIALHFNETSLLASTCTLTSQF